MTQCSVQGPFAPAFPVVGSSDSLGKIFHDPIACLRHLFENHGHLVAFRKGQLHSLFAFGPDYNRHLLNHPDTFHALGFFPGPKNSAQRRLGCGLFNMNGDRHKLQRRLVMPAFRKEALESHGDSLIRITEQILGGWQDGQQRDIAVDMKTLALRVTNRLLFGLEDDSLAAAIEQLFEPWLEANHLVSFEAALPLHLDEAIYPRMLAYAEQLEGLFRRLIEQKRATTTGGEDLLSLLLQARAAGVINEIEVVGQATHFFNAANHTTAHALTWTLFLLAQHPAVMADLFDELGARLHGAAPKPEQLGQLHLLERVIKESLRLLPPVVYFARINTEPFQFGPYRLAPRTLVVGSQYVTHHMAECYPEPERFWPGRWLQATPSPHAYLAFSGGPRMCIGTSLSLLVMKIALAIILQRYRLTVVAGARIDRKGKLTLGPKYGMPMVVRRQDRQFTSSVVQGTIHEMVTLS